ncbi:unnamed protein product [Ranitomeya imitator]|uniref:Chemokine interleukin-8-like domain-containing protein n=1 Tax=Ranitomeya imitator TaxID=111125 RepID=A0ABN9MNM9_9NEOB|nr:unnamed protein product [Ranitomeya imitator]
MKPIHLLSTGMSLLGKRRCLCMGNGADHVDLKQIKKFEFFPPSSKCEKMEVMYVTLYHINTKCRLN